MRKDYGFNPKDVDYLKFTYEHGIGTYLEDEIEIRGKTVQEAARKFKHAPMDFSIYPEYNIHWEGACSTA